ncbi:potassium transporter Kup [Nocardioides lacus]|uniref:potassium transporter Kup n=1 Tax=Nocardioides sp. BP30 TaxID=3036374 RepID=UPI00406D1103
MVTLGALGVVFGDIGTSPLYSLKTLFSIDDHAIKPTPGDVYGVISMVVWSVTLIVSIKYIGVIMRADNGGEGGVMALAGIARRAIGAKSRRVGVVIVLAIVGASLFFGDSVITPAISVLSAVEGVSVAAPSLTHLVLPISITILVVLFATQRYGTHRVGAFFGPAMLVWFTVLALAGLRVVIPHPGILRSLSPTYALAFMIEHPLITFIAMGAVVLCITGAEALYADMGHFGRRPIALAWFVFVFPALVLTYMGQGELILRDPSAISNPFFLLVPGWAQVPMVVMATIATVIASQAVISGAFSVSRQATQLGLLPSLTVRQTSEGSAGQVYLPVINAVLFVGVLALMLVFRSSDRLATAYGVSVTGALLIDTILMLVVARLQWKWATWRLVLFAIIFGGMELSFLIGNLNKIPHGGWLPLLIATVMFTLMSTWYRGREIVTDSRVHKEGRLVDFVQDLHEHPVHRVPGMAVFPHPSKETTPLAMRANVDHIGVLHERVVIFTAIPQTVPHVPVHKAFAFDPLGFTGDGIMHVTMRYGFFDRPDIPAALHAHLHDSGWEFIPDLEQVTYFLSRANLAPQAHHGKLPRWRKALFVLMARNAANPAEYFNLPSERVVVMGSQIDL